MRRFHSLWVLAALLLASAGGLGAAPAKAAGCRACHDDFKQLLGDAHPPVKGRAIAECLPCHGKASGKGAFSVRIHRGHSAPDSGVACAACHDFKVGRSFSVKGAKASLGKPDAADFARAREFMPVPGDSGFLASHHAKKLVSCAGCHGGAFPLRGTEVANATCLACHGTPEALAEKTRPKEAHGLNPHKSHYGDIACTACHFGHQPSVVLCKDCHPKTTLAVPFGK
ncbi:cytochrome c3 family protein [Mesoterricola silvestris]|uniref:Tetrahaem cytochrome domain-containing protein n=1 Tax=Mesoterricola silvestris TaxID=2927979 RepID=A0AA48K9P1_9BACT|nr:cytochrome c3 family protein [Mesoterricola silvestris]BDU72532.1 hypothetical protein METEAL_17060 [Mesoterricola silvestris]